MFHIALVEPEIPPNTGNVARLCAATKTPLHIVGVPGFRMDEKAVRRAGLDYWDQVQLFRHRDLRALYQALPKSRFVYVETETTQNYTDWKFEINDCLVFGRETKGLPAEVLAENRDRVIRIPIFNANVRSLNLSNSVAIVLYEALRQLTINA